MLSCRKSYCRNLALAGVSLVSLATPALAAEAADDNASNTDIIVEARRKSESVQDVPLVVNAVTSQQLDKLNVRDFKDVATLVPGLSLTPATDGIAPAATLRGVNYDVNNSGSNATVQFYLNDAPIAAGFLFQSMFDVGQIEVLRGPQGTLRGIAAPSGSITVTTRRPDLNEIGGYATGTVNDIGGLNFNAAVGMPIVKGVLAVRVAGIYSDDEGARVHSLNAPNAGSYSHARGVRAAVRFDPIDGIDIEGTYQHLLTRSNFYDQVESANLAYGLPAVGTLLTAKDRAALTDRPRTGRNEYNIYNLRAEWKFAGQKLSFVGGWSDQDIQTQYTDDAGNAWDSSYPGSGSADPINSPNLQNYGQVTHTMSQQQSYELRLSSDERLFGMLDYVVGGLINRQNAPTDLVFQTPIFAAAPSPVTFYAFNQTPFSLRGRTLERSAFGNATLHFGDATELSGGLRYIHFNNIDNLTGTHDFHATVWSGSLKHRFNENVMAYASAGSSWRVGAGTNAVILGASGNTGFTDLALVGILAPTPEKSKSYEAGIKTDWMDKKLRVNLSYYHQDFDNYIFSSPTVLFQAYNATTLTYTPSVSRSGLGVGVPVKVDGVEGEIVFAPSRNFSVAATASYSLGKISNGLVPCSGASLPTPPKQINFCTVNQRSSLGSPFNATVDADYSHPLTGEIDGVLRGQLTWRGDSQNDPTNPYDDVKGYALVNLFAGLRADNGAWEVTAYAKNLFNTFRVLTRDALPKLTAYATFTGGGAIVTNYRGVTVTAPREFGVTARFTFGSH